MILGKHCRDRIPFCRKIKQRKIIIFRIHPAAVPRIDITKFIYQRISDQLKIFKSKRAAKIQFVLSLWILGVSVKHPVSYIGDRKSTRLNSSHVAISYAVFCLKKKKKPNDA